MFSSILTASFVAALVPEALAKLCITAPVMQTVCQAKQPCIIAWNDDGVSPSLSQIGNCSVGIYIGSQTTQLQLQPLGFIDVSQQPSYNFTPNPIVGGNSPQYFIRFTSVGLSEGIYPYEGFSAKFTLAGMTGTFNSTEEALMTASVSSVASTTTGAVSTASLNSTGIVTTTAKPTGTTTSSKSTATTPSNGAAAPAFGSSSHAAAFVAVVAAAFAAAAF